MYARVDSAAAAVAKLASSALTAAGVPFWLSEAGSLFSVFLGRTAPVRSFADAKDQSAAAYAAFFHAMLDGGVYLPPSATRRGSCPPPTTTRRCPVSPPPSPPPPAPPPPSSTPSRRA